MIKIEKKDQLILGFHRISNEILITSFFFYNDQKMKGYIENMYEEVLETDLKEENFVELNSKQTEDLVFNTFIKNIKTDDAYIFFDDQFLDFLAYLQKI